ncbi:DUF1542 domain-containing protein [uncultured Fructobacillus sp.]|uniref:DUF1542 domain-containing protein n=1 Tax=uncultured Fructobacillus sp. TaxID=591942 RepID=UPI002596EF0D|nr:DUF1542 domain-containing protein [uncultured Fructobacillus sp.]
MDNSLNIKNHYKMYKSGKQWIFAAIAAFAIAGAVGMVQPGAIWGTPGHQVAADSTGTTTNGFDTTPYFPKGDQSGLGTVSFGSKREALIGKYTTLPVQTNVAADAKNSAQSINYQVKNVYVYLNPDNIVNGQPQLVAVYVPGKTAISISPNGAKNTVSVDIGQNTGQWNNTPLQAGIPNKSQDSGWTNINSVYTNPGTWQDFTVNNLSDSDAAKYNAVRLSFISDSSKGASGNQDYYMNLNVKFKNYTPLQQEVQQQIANQDQLDANRKVDLSALANEGEKTKATISNDKTLTTAQKQAAEKQVDANVEAAQAKLNDTSYLKDYAANKSAADALASSQYTPGKPVDTQRSDEQITLNNSADAQKKLIDADNGLTDAQKAEQKTTIDNALKNATTALNNATDADDIQNVINGSDANTINNGYQKSTTTPAQQRNDAVSNQQSAVDAATSSNGRINTDPTLSTTDRQARISAINDAFNQLKNLPDSATAQDVASAQAAVQKSISDGETSGTPVDQQKLDAISKFKADNNVAQKLADIAKDPTLTDDEKSNQEKAINSAVDTVTNNINNATDADGVNTAEGDQVAASTIADAHQPASAATQAQRKQDALSAVADAQSKAEAAVDSDANLTTQEKADQKSAIDMAAGKLNDQINGVNGETATAQNDANIQKNAAANLNALHQVGQELQSRKDAAAGQIQTQADQLKQDVTNSSLPQKEKDAQIKSIQSAADNAKAKIQAAATADAVVTDLKNGNQDLTDLASAQTAATKKINDAVSAADAAVDKAKNAIDNSDLSDSAKAAQKKAIDDIADSAKDQANAATDANNVENASNAAAAFINSINQKKSDSRKSVDTQVSAAHDKVNSNNNLTQAQKNQLNEAIDVAADTAKHNIDTALTTDAITQGQSSADLTNAINNANQPDQVKNLPDGGYQTLDNQKANAKNAIDTAATNAKNAVDQNNNLTPDEKTTQKNAIDNAATTAKSNVDAAKDAQTASDATNNGQNLINGLNQEKQAARNNIDSQITAAHDKVNNNNNLTQAQKDQLNGAIDTAARAAKSNIDKAETPDAVNTAQNDKDLATAVQNANDPANDTNLTNGGYQTLADQKANAKNAIDTAATNAKNAVDQNNNLTPDEKTTQKNAIDNAATTAKSNVDAAKDAQTASDATNNGQNLINGLNQEKQAARNNIDSQITAAHDKVNNNNNLTQAQKDQLNGAIDTAARAAKSNIDKAETPDAVNTAQNDKDLATAVQNANDPANDTNLTNGGYQTLADQKANAKNAIDAAATNAKQAIDSEAGLSANDKQAQKDAIDATATAAQQNVTNAKDAQGAADAVKNGQDLINAQKDADNTLAQKATAGRDAIQSNPALNDSGDVNDINSKAHALQDFNSQVAAAQNTINSAKTPTDATNAVAKGSDLDKAANALTANKQIDDAAKDAKSKVEADPNLSVDDKKAQEAVVDQQAQAAKVAASVAAQNQDATALNKAVTDAKTNIGGLADAKRAADDALANKVQAAKDAINNNGDLTDAQKQSRLHDVANAQKKAQESINTANTPNAASAASDDKSDLAQTVNNAKNFSDVTPLADQKANAVKALQATAQQAKANIDQNPGLSAADKAVQKISIDQQETDQEKTISGSIDAQHLVNNQSAGEIAVTDLAKNMSDTSAAIAQNVADLNKSIDADDKLTPDQKTAQKEALAKVSQSYQDRVNSSKDAASAAAAQQPSITGLVNLNNSKLTAYANINKAHNQALKDIEQDQNLTSTAKAAQKAAVEAATEAATKKIDVAVVPADSENGTDVQSISEQITTSLTQLNSDKNSARQKVQNQANQVINAINADSNLSDNEKISQIKDIEAAVVKAQSQIDAGQTSDVVNAVPESSDVKQKIMNGHQQSTDSLSQQKQKALATLVDQAAQAKAAVNADNTLSSKEKTSQTAVIDQALNEAKDAVNDATTAQKILDVKLQTIDKVMEAHQPGKDLPIQKAAAITLIDQKAAFIRNQIANDSNLTQDQKNADYAKLNAAVAKAKAEVNGALNADDILSGLDYGTSQAETSYKKAVQKQYEINDQQNQKVATLPATAETRVARSYNDVAGALALLSGLTLFFTRRKKNKD